MKNEAGRRGGTLLNSRRASDYVFLGLRIIHRHLDAASTPKKHTVQHVWSPRPIYNQVGHKFSIIMMRYERFPITKSILSLGSAKA